MKAFYQYLVFDQHGRYGSGGWSSKAKHRLLPRTVEGWCELPEEHIKATGTVEINGISRKKLNLIALKDCGCATCPQDILKREDYPNIVPAWWKDPVAVIARFQQKVSHGLQSQSQT